MKHSYIAKLCGCVFDLLVSASMNVQAHKNLIIALLLEPLCSESKKLNKTIWNRWKKPTGMVIEA